SRYFPLADRHQLRLELGPRLVQGGGHGAGVDVEGVRDLLVTQLFEITQTEDGRLALGQPGHRLTEPVHQLREAVAGLPEREAAVFCLRYFEELSYQQIADTLDINAGAVAAALHKARAKLEAQLMPVRQGEIS